MKAGFIAILVILSFSAMAQIESFVGRDLKGDQCSLSMDYSSNMISFTESSGMCEFPVELGDMSRARNRRENRESFKISGYSNWYNCQVKMKFDAEGQVKTIILTRSMPLILSLHQTRCHLKGTQNESDEN